MNKDNENCTLILTDEIECEKYQSNVDEDISKAMNTRYDITALKENVNLAMSYFEIAKVLTSSSALNGRYK